MNTERDKAPAKSLLSSDSTLSRNQGGTEGQSSVPPQLLSRANTPYGCGVRDGFLLGMQLGLEQSNEQLARIIGAVEDNYEEAQ